MKDKEFRFNRYINGKLMAEGITTVASNYDEAVNKATRAYGKDTVVLILNNTIDPRDEALRVAESALLHIQQRAEPLGIDIGDSITHLMATDALEAIRGAR